MILKDNNSENNEYLGSVMVGIDKEIRKTSELHQDVFALETREHNSHQDEGVGSTINFIESMKNKV